MYSPEKVGDLRFIIACNEDTQSSAMTQGITNFDQNFDFPRLDSNKKHYIMANAVFFAVKPNASVLDSTINIGRYNVLQVQSVGGRIGKVVSTNGSYAELLLLVDISQFQNTDISYYNDTDSFGFVISNPSEVAVPIYESTGPWKINILDYNGNNHPLLKRFAINLYCTIFTGDTD